MKYSLKKKSKKFIFIFVLILTIICLILSLSGYLGKYNVYLELTSHFKVQYLYFSLFISLFSAIFSFKRLALISLFCFILNFVEVGHWYLPQSNNLQPIDSINLKVMLSNIYGNNNQYQKVIDLIKQENPDIIVLQEYTAIWDQELTSIETIYPYTLKRNRQDNFGMAIYSKIPLEKSDTLYFSEANIPTFYTHFTLQNQEIDLIAIHPFPPLNSSLFSLRNQELNQTANYFNQIKNNSDHQIIIGDFNTTMWSPIYRQFSQQTNLKNTRLGFGILPTWRVDSFIFAIPIDHCLISQNIQVKNFKVGNNINSDHLPIIADLLIYNN
jgi:endonuclease/exonuclease/phosphatase (EEP) superfamily protein YafD